MIAFKWPLIAVDIFNVNFKLGSCGECGRTLIAMIVLNFKVSLQMLFNVLLLERSQATNVAFKSLLFQMNTLIVTTKVGREEGFSTIGTEFSKNKLSEHKLNLLGENLLFLSWIVG